MSRRVREQPLDFSCRLAPPLQQSGMALMVVLMVLVLIMLIGAIAIRGSSTDLKLSTAAQVNQLLFQSNDAALMKVEKEDRILTSQRGRADTLKGYMSSPQRAGHEVSFCVRPRKPYLFNVLEISERNAAGQQLASRNNGYCEPSNPEDYVSEGRVITQMTFIRPLGDASEAVFTREVEGTFSNDFKKPENDGVSGADCSQFIGYVTSVIPSLSSASLSDIGECLKQPRSGSITVDSCLTELGVPYQTQQQVYLNQPVGVKCVSAS